MSTDSGYSFKNGNHQYNANYYNQFNPEYTGTITTPELIEQLNASISSAKKYNKKLIFVLENVNDITVENCPSVTCTTYIVLLIILSVIVCGLIGYIAYKK